MVNKASNGARSRSTLSDVAEMAGVSESTVSLVLAGKGEKRRISSDTHARVQHAARTLGYTPSLLHRSLQRGRTHVISLYNAFRNRDRGDLYMDRLSSAVEHAGGSLGYDILVHSNYRRSTQETYEFLNGGLADGLVLFGPTADEPLLPLLRRSGLPTVVIGPRERETELSTVLDDETMGMRMIARSLVDNGHRHIAAITQPAGGVLDPTGRVGLLQTELAELGVELKNDSVLEWANTPDETLKRLASLNPNPSALFVWHDRTAYRVAEALESRGFEIPEQISIVGYDGLVWPSTSRHIVTSVSVPLDEMAQAGIAILDRLIQGEPGPLSTTLPVTFLAGTTLGPAASKALIQ